MRPHEIIFKDLLIMEAAMSRQLSAIANPVRLRIVRLLMDGELHVGAINAIIGGSQPALSQHLKILHLAGLLKSRRDSRNIYYWISNPHLPTLLRETERMSVYL